jgi:hypothetical protein
MRSNAGIANRKGDVDLREAQVSASSYNFGLAWLGCDGRRCWVLSSAEQRLELNRASVAEMRGGERKGMYCHVGVSPIPHNLLELKGPVTTRKAVFILVPKSSLNYLAL